MHIRPTATVVGPVSQLNYLPGCPVAPQWAKNPSAQWHSLGKYGLCGKHLPPRLH
jgi:hypothetical protein